MIPDSIAILHIVVLVPRRHYVLVLGTGAPRYRKHVINSNLSGPFKMAATSYVAGIPKSPEACLIEALNKATLVI